MRFLLIATPYHAGMFRSMLGKYNCVLHGFPNSLLSVQFLADVDSSEFPVDLTDEAEYYLEWQRSWPERLDESYPFVNPVLHRGVVAWECDGWSYRNFFTAARLKAPGRLKLTPKDRVAGRKRVLISDDDCWRWEATYQ